MKHKIFVLGLALAATLFAGAAYGQPPSTAQTPALTEQRSSLDKTEKPLYKHIDELGMQDRELWILLGVTVSSGAFGGLVYYLMNFREIQNILILMAYQENKQRKLAAGDCSKGEMNHTFANVMCCLSKMAIGAASAPAVIMLFRPESVFALLATSVVAGSAGTAILRNVQKKLMELTVEVDKNLLEHLPNNLPIGLTESEQAATLSKDSLSENTRNGASHVDVP
jgi:hypothetical protein